MKIDEAKRKFIASWGMLSSKWGISRGMAQVHALLLVSHQSLTAEDIMSTLKISRGNANMTTRDLINWGLVKKELRTGERKEYFRAEKDIWKVFIRIVKERRKREMEPLLLVLSEFDGLEGSNKDPEIKAFKQVVEDMNELAGKADKLMEALVKSDENWFMNAFFKLVR